MTDLERFNHEQLRDQVRIRLAARLERLLNAFDTILDDDPREFSASQLSVYLQAVRIQGDLYQVRERPDSDDRMVSVDKVQKLVDAAVAVAVEEARADERRRLEAERVVELEDAGAVLRRRLEEVRMKAAGGVQGS